MILNHLGQKEWLGFAWFSKSPLLSCFPICQEVLHLSKIINGIPWNHTAMFHPCLIATVQQMSLRLFCLPLFCTVIRFGSMEYGVHGLHDKSSQDLPNSNEFSAQTIVYFTKARQTFAILCFPRIRFESIGSPNFVHRLRIGDCCEIHLHHWRHCILLLLSHQMFLPEILLHNFASRKEPLNFWLACILRNFGHCLESDSEYCASCKPLPKAVQNLSHEKCLWVEALLYLRDYLCPPLITLEGRALDLSLPDVCPHFRLIFQIVRHSCRIASVSRRSMISIVTASCGWTRRCTR